MAQARILTDKEYRKVLLHIAKKKHHARNKCMLFLSHLAGLRAIEIASLTIKDVLAEDGTIKDEFFLRARQTKGDRGRTVLVPKKLQDELQDYLSTRFKLKANDLQVLHFTDTSKALFYTQKTSQRGFSANTLAQWFGTIYRECSIDGASSHSGRRHFATFLNESSVSPKSMRNAVELLS